ncbi:MAG: hypothetical protein ABI870_06845 [Rhodanobacter sp.]
MKKISLLATLPALAFAGLLLSGCGMFRSHKSWDTAQQQAPLEIPPGLDRPSTSDALEIPPPGANQPTANGATASVGTASGQIADGFVMTDSVDNSYRRVGQALSGGSIGQVTSHDDAAHSYTLSVPANGVQKKRGFFGRMFHHDKTDSANGGSGNMFPVVVTVGSSGTNASEVRAQGNPAAVAKVIDALKTSMGG